MGLPALNAALISLHAFLLKYCQKGVIYHGPVLSNAMTMSAEVQRDQI